MRARSGRIPETTNHSVAKSVLKQLHQRAAREGNVTSLSLTRLEVISDQAGSSSLQAIFPDTQRGGSLRINLSYLLDFPHLWELFSEGFMAWGSPMANTTRREVSRNLGRYFFKFLADTGRTNIAPNEIDDQALADYFNYLSSARENKKPLHPNTVGDALGAVRVVLNALFENKRWAFISSWIAERVPSGPPGAEQKSEPTEVLSLVDLKEISRVAELEVLRLHERWEQGKALLTDGKIELAKGSRDFRKNLGLCLAALDAKYPGVIPDFERIIEFDKTLGYAVIEKFGAREVMRYFYPTSRDLVPFAILLGFETVFNPDTLLALTWANIDLNYDRIGSPAIKIVGMKPRASNDHVRVIDGGSAEVGKVNGKFLFSLLREMAARLRPWVRDPGDRDKVFLYIQQNFCKEPKSFGESHSSGASSDGTWRRALANFCSENNLPKFNLGQLRATLIDLTQSINSDLSAAQALGNHRSPQTTWTHYTSSGVKKRYLERIGEVLLLRERWFGSKGIIDPRWSRRTEDKGAATPGFICFDPFDSPRPNQKHGQACTAYGECPGCPLAAAKIGDPICVAQYEALKRSIFLSQANMSSQTWMIRWVPVLEDLNSLLDGVSGSVRKASEKFHFNMPPVG